MYNPRTWFLRIVLWEWMDSKSHALYLEYLNWTRRIWWHHINTLSWRNNTFDAPFSSMRLQFAFFLRSTESTEYKYFIIKLFWNSIFSNVLVNQLKKNGSLTSKKVLLASFNLKRTVSSNCWGFISIDSENNKILLSQETDLMPLAVIQPRTC